jgi:hypothetical protein
VNYWSVFVLTFVLGCGGDEHVCKPTGPPTAESYEWPADCELVDCHGMTACDITCPNAASCPRLDCSGVSECRLDCLGTCDDLDCRNGGICTAECFPGTTCATRCDGADSCSIRCSGGACLIDCGSATSCNFNRCTDASGNTAQMTDCGGGILVCNRACP